MSIPGRSASVDALATRTFDLLVIGGGITGSGIARDAALRGLSVALVERDDFASGTSSRSSRLIHGGVRYLEYAQLHLVFEASAERRRLLRLAPHLVRPLPFVWPVYRGARIPRWKLSLGLTLYDALAVFRNVGRHRRLTAREVLDAEPALRSEGLLGGARYYDAATDDARITMANALGAIGAGAVLVNHIAATAFDLHAGTVRGISAFDSIDQQSVAIRAKIVVNATGPWSDDVGRLESGRAGVRVRGSKGVHIAVSRDRLANHQALTLLAPHDGRVTFALPDGALAIVGTTDSYTSESASDVRATEADVAYLLDMANTFFPTARLRRDDVVATWAGIRPLIAKSATSSVSASREHAITTSPGGVVTITGGKLTTYRIMASDVVDLVVRRLGRRVEKSPTLDLPLPGGDLASVERAETEAAAALGDRVIAQRLVAAHGSGWPEVAREIKETDDGALRIEPTFPYTIGEMRFAVRQELACTLADLLMRRTRLAFETRDHGRQAAEVVASAIAPILQWSETRRNEELAAFDREVRRVFAVDAVEPD